MKPFVVITVIKGSANSVNLEPEDLEYLKNSFEKEKLEMIITNEETPGYRVERLTKKELVDFVELVTKREKDNAEKMKMQIELVLQSQTQYIN